MGNACKNPKAPEPIAELEGLGKVSKNNNSKKQMVSGAKGTAELFKKDQNKDDFASLDMNGVSSEYQGQEQGNE